ncbi:MAG: ABC transporter ATP-binding protein [Deltaproteobacteria bacterium]|nr:MAG: ABC transporter ATP-binding protein [Deltaproteobacteria bacterium]
MRTYLRLLGYLRPHLPGFFAAIGCMVVLALTTGVYAYLVGPVLEFLVTGGQKGVDAVARLLPSVDLSQLDREAVLWVLPAVILLTGLLKGASYFGQFYLMGMTGQKVVVDLRRHLFAHLLALSPGWFTRHHSGDLISRFTNDIAKVETAVTYAVTSILRDALQVIVLVGVAFYLDWRLSILAFGVIPLTLFPIVRFARRLRRVTGHSNEVMGQITERIHEAIGGIRIVQAYGQEAAERERFDRLNDDFVRVMRRSFLVRGLSTPTMEVMAVTGVALTLWLAGDAIARGTLDAAKFLSFFATIMLMYQPVKSLGRLGQFVVTGAASAERIFEILDQHPEIHDAPDAVAAPRFEHGVRFEEVSFSYQGPEGPKVLDRVSFEIARGEVVALVGPSGGGKSTLASLLLRFHDPTEGRVTLDGIDLRRIRVASLRQLLAVVSQDTIVFNDTVRANVAYGRPEAPDEAVWAALERAQARAFVEALPDGLHTRLGERGVTLSGGQRQRLSIARAILKDAPLLILDEATSQLDAESEAAVQAALTELMAGRTTLVIAHRLATVQRADRILVVEGGRVVEAGTHGELLRLGGLYSRLHALQRLSGVAPSDLGASLDEWKAEPGA